MIPHAPQPLSTATSLAENALTPTVAGSSVAKVLAYEQPELPEVDHHRPRWVYAIAITYALILAAIVAALVIASLQRDFHEFRVPVVIGIGLVLTAEAGLIAIPVRSRGRRPVSKRSLWVPIAATGFFSGLLLLGAAMSIGEWLNVLDEDVFHIMILAAALLWGLWGLIFWLMSPAGDVSPFANRLHRYLLAGSILELLIAVPTHIVVRRRTECCAGIATGMGICGGVIIMFLGFGPSVVLLYYRRWRKVTNAPEHRTAG